MYSPSFLRAGTLVLFSFVAAVTLSACGSPEPTSGGTAAPPIDETPAQYSAQDPFAAYLDLSHLSQKTLDQCTQMIDQESTENGITVHVSQTLGDAMTLYVAYEITYPNTIDIGDPTTYLSGSQYNFPDTMLTLTEGTISDLNQTVTSIPGSGVSINYSQTGEHTVAGIFTLTFPTPDLQGKVVSMIFRDPYVNSSHVFTWTLNSDTDIQTIPLQNAIGQPAGTAFLSPFGLTIALDSPAEAGNTWYDQIILLDQSGQPIETGSGAGSDEGSQNFSYCFFIPVETTAVKTIQAGPYTGTL